MGKEKSTTKMFEGLPSIIYVVVAWIGYWYTIYAYGCGLTTYNWA
jgi:methanethiol S-methyltransferase